MKRLILAALALSALVACSGTIDTEGKSTTTGTGTGGTAGTTTTTTTSGTTTTSTTNTSSSTSISCGSTQKYAEPGCGDPPPGVTPLPSVGCYAECTTVGALCPSGGTCKKTWTNPCPCPNPNEPCCGACGGEDLRCLP